MNGFLRLTVLDVWVPGRGAPRNVNGNDRDCSCGWLRLSTWLSHLNVCGFGHRPSVPDCATLYKWRGMRNDRVCN